MSLATAEEESWVDGTRRYLKAPWLRHTLADDLLDAGAVAVWHMPNRGGMLDRSDANAELFREADATVFPQQEPGRGIFSPSGLATMADRLLAALPEGSLDHRVVRDATEVLCSSEAALARVQELEERFERLLKRAERQRNAVVHGTGTAPAVLETVERFLHLTGRYVAQENMRSAETGEERLIELERSRYRLLDEKARLQSGDDPVEVLFPGE